MKRIIALDLGTKKCGIAISDPLQIISQPLTIIYYEPQNFEFLISEIKKIIDDYKPIESILLGIPKNTRNYISPTEKIIYKFEKLIKDKFTNINIILVDENYSSKHADKLMYEMNYNKNKKKKSRDMLAAQIILENYLVLVKK